LASAPPVNPEAHEAYLKGCYYFGKYNPDAFQNAVRFFNVALEKDPSYAVAYAGLALAYAAPGYWGFIPPREIHPKLRALASKAAEMGAGDAQGTIGAIMSWLDWGLSAVIKEFERAVELFPSDTYARLNHAILLGSIGRLREGMAEAKRALELDPLNLAAHSIVGWHFYASRKYEQAIEQYKKGLDIDPNFFILHWDLWRAFRQAGRLEEAMAECKTMLSLRGNSEAIEPMERGYAESGYRGAMLHAAKKLAEQFETRYFPPSDIALLFNHADEKDEALHWLEIGYEERDPRLHTIGVDPHWDSQRESPRFQDLLRRMNFPE
jgi:tetratricopeptide (TPR) repeat protein